MVSKVAVNPTLGITLPELITLIIEQKTNFHNSGKEDCLALGKWGSHFDKFLIAKIFSAGNTENLSCGRLFAAGGNFFKDIEILL